MKLKKTQKHILILLIILALPCAICNKTYAIQTKQNSSYSQSKKQKKEYKKYKIKKIKHTYYYKKKRIRIFYDPDGNFYYDRNGKVDLKIIRNKKHKIKKVTHLSRKKAKQILDNVSTAYISAQ